MTQLSKLSGQRQKHLNQRKKITLALRDSDLIKTIRFLLALANTSSHKPAKCATLNLKWLVTSQALIEGLTTCIQVKIIQE